MHRLIEYVTKLLKVKRVSRTVILTTGLLAITIIFITIYATQVGNFIIRVNTNQYKLYLCEHEDFAEPKSLLHALNVKEMRDNTLDWIPIDDHKMTDGSSNDSAKSVLAYTFYLQNQSDVTIDYNIRLGINEVYRGVDEATWIYVCETRDNVESVNVYAKKQSSKGKDPGMPEVLPPISEHNPVKEQVTQTIPFKSSLTVFDYNVKNMRHNEIVKYTVIMWLEGEDADCVNDLFGGSIRMEMQFSAYRE